MPDLIYLFAITIQHEENENSGRSSFRCQFASDEECIGNKIHACAIKYVNDTNELIEFFNEFTDLEGEEDIDEIIEVKVAIDTEKVQLKLQTESVHMETP